MGSISKNIERLHEARSAWKELNAISEKINGLSGENPEKLSAKKMAKKARKLEGAISRRENDLDNATWQHRAKTDQKIERNQRKIEDIGRRDRSLVKGVKDIIGKNVMGAISGDVTASAAAGLAGGILLLLATALLKLTMKVSRHRERKIARLQKANEALVHSRDSAGDGQSALEDLDRRHENEIAKLEDQIANVEESIAENEKQLMGVDGEIEAMEEKFIQEAMEAEKLTPENINNEENKETVERAREKAIENLENSPDYKALIEKREEIKDSGKELKSQLEQLQERKAELPNQHLAERTAMIEGMSTDRKAANKTLKNARRAARPRLVRAGLKTVRAPKRGVKKLIKRQEVKAADREKNPSWSMKSSLTAIFSKFSSPTPKSSSPEATAPAVAPVQAPPRSKVDFKRFMPKKREGVHGVKPEKKRELIKRKAKGIVRSRSSSAASGA